MSETELDFASIAARLLQLEENQVIKVQKRKWESAQMIGKLSSN
jgi:hypothetical protein